MITEELTKLIETLKKECERLTMTNIEIYDVQGYSPLTDVVIIATADHILQLEAARRSLALIAKQAGYPIQNPTEDFSEGWLAMDFSDLVIHILIEEKRHFYDLDSLMDNIKNSRKENNQEYNYEEEEASDIELEEIINQLNPDEIEELLEDISEFEKD